MQKRLNIGNRESSLELLKQIKNGDYVPFDLKITNSHITELNERIGFKAFKNDVLYINSESLSDLMKPVGTIRKHNCHGLTPEDIYTALLSIRNPKIVFAAKRGRYAVISIELCHFAIPLMTIIDTGVGLLTDVNARVNKIITIYPKDKVKDNKK